MTTLLIDGDILAFQAAAATEVATKWDDDMWTLHASEADGQRHIKDALVSIQNATGCKVMRVFLTGKKNYRTEILGTYKGNRKDFLCVPCRLYNPRHSDRGVVTVSLDMADRYFYSQVLTGDASDNYKGCPQVGPVKADKILDAAEADYWPAVVTAFEKAGLCVDDALVQARCARILRVGDLIPYQEEPPLWTPP